MRISDFKKKRDLKLTIKLDELEVYHPANHKLVKLVKDGRSFKAVNGFWHVHPIGFSQNLKTVYIVCPFCGEVHRHGNASGHRISHCKAQKSDNEGYVIVFTN